MAMVGEITTFIAALGHGTTSREVARAFALAPPDVLEAPWRQRGHVYEQLFAQASGVSYKFKDDALIRVVVYFVPLRGYTPYARPDELVVGIVPSSTPSQVREILGTPVESDEYADDFAIEKGIVFVEYGDGGVDSVSAMISPD